MDKIAYFLSILAGIMLIVLNVTHMSQAKKFLVDIETELTTINKSLKHLNRDFSNFPPNLSDLEKR